MSGLIEGSGDRVEELLLVVVVDQAGNKSNVIETDPILILKE